MSLNGRGGADNAVLVSGASGFIASWICLYLLERGHAVRGTTRSEKKGEWMKVMFGDRGYDKFEYVVVTDLENVSCQSEAANDEDGAFDEAVLGVE